MKISLALSVLFFIASANAFTPPYHLLEGRRVSRRDTHQSHFRSYQDWWKAHEKLRGLRTNVACRKTLSEITKYTSRLREIENIKLISTPGDESKRNSLLRKAYIECERITAAYAKTFYLGTKFMEANKCKYVWAIYVWCRRTDDIVDSPRAAVSNTMESDLEEWEERLDNVFDRGTAVDYLDLALVDTKEKFPSLSIEPFRDMIKGMIMDIPGRGQNRYKSFQELELYCYRVAGTVGLMTLPILGTADGVVEEEAKEPALSLGIALQLTNILRDVGEDAVRGRIYLPQEELEQFGVSESQILNGIVDANYKELMRFQIARARDYYKKAQEGIKMLAPSARLPVQASLDMYSKILDVLEKNDFDNFRKRAYVSKLEKLAVLPFSWWRSRSS